MRWCDVYGVAKNPNKFGEDVIIELGNRPDNGDDWSIDTVAAIRLDKEGAKRLIDMLQQYIGE